MIHIEFLLLTEIMQGRENYNPSLLKLKGDVAGLHKLRNAIETTNISVPLGHRPKKAPAEIATFVT